MATSEAKDLEGTSEPINCKSCVLRVSIHCEGCKRKVIKILHKIHGVHAVEIDRKQHKVTVTTNIDEQTLIRRLIKAGKHAEPWPESKPISKNIKEKQIAMEIPVCQTSAAVHDGGKQKQSTEAEAPAKEVPFPSKNKENCGIRGNAQVLEISKGSDGGEAAVQIDGVAVERVVESTSEGSGGKNIAGETQPGGPSGAVAVEASSGGGGEGRKKKKRKGQRKEKSGGGEGGVAIVGDVMNPQIVPTPGSIGSATPHDPHHDPIPSSNHAPPFNQPYNYPVHTIVTQPTYVANYNTTHSSNTYGSYYVEPIPNSFVHSVALRNMSPPSPPLPLVEQSNSTASSPFDFFSDENPSGCWVM